MKVRFGFVSNSSSSSFVVAIRKPTKKTIDAVKFIEFVAKHTEKNPIWSNVFGIAAKQKAIKAEIDELKKDMAFGYKEVEFWRNVGEDGLFDGWLGKLKEHFRAFKPGGGEVRQLRSMSEYRENLSEMGQTPCKLMSQWIKNVVDRDKDKLVELEKELAQLKNLKNSEWAIYSFEEDMHWGKNLVSNIVTDLVKQGQAIILKKHNS